MTLDYSMEAKRQYVRQHHLQDAFPEESLAITELHRFNKGEYLCQAGERIEFFHIVMEGRCHVLPSSESGKEFLMDYLEPLGLNGDIELFNECEALHSVRASTPVAALAISRKVFFGEMMQSPEFLKMLCKNFANKVYSISMRHSSNMLYSIKHRLNRILLDAANSQDSDIISIKMADIAQTLGISARHLRRVLVSYEEKNILRRHSHTIQIINLDALHK